MELHILIAVLAAAIPVFLFVHELYEQLAYRTQSLRRCCSLPYLYRFYPLGLPSILVLKRAQEEHRLLTLFDDIFKAVKKRTFRAQAVCDFPLVTVDPENLKAIMATQFNDFDLGDRHAQLQVLLGSGIFVADGWLWKHSRAMLRPQFVRDQLSRLESIEQHAQTLLQHLFFTSRYRGVVDVQPLFHDFTLDVATEFLFGESVGCLQGHKILGGENSKFASTSEFGDAFKVCQDVLMRRAQLGKLHWLCDSPNFRKNVATCHKFVDYFVEKALAMTPEEKMTQNRYIFLTALTEETRDPVMLRDQSLNVLLAGRDTTASVFGFLLYSLVRNKDAWVRLRQEVIAQFGYGPEDLTYESLRRCQYLKWVVNEVLRLYPPVPFLFRQAQRDTTLPKGGGPDENDTIFVKKGGLVYYSTYTLHRDQEFWGPDADDFRPERWSEMAPTSTIWKFIPFGGGPRLCLGQNLAITEVSYLLVRLCQTFKDIYSTPEKLAEPLLQRTALSLQVENGVHCAFSLDEKSDFVPAF